MSSSIATTPVFKWRPSLHAHSAPMLLLPRPSPQMPQATAERLCACQVPSTSTTPSQGAGVKKNEEALALRLDELTITIHSKLCKLECKVQLLSSMMHDLIVKSTLMTRWQKKEQTITYVSSIPRTKFSNPSYKKAIPEILQVLRAACIIHEADATQMRTADTASLPLMQHAT